MTKDKQRLAKEYLITSRNIKDLSLMELLQFYFEVATEKDLDLENVLPVDILQKIDEVEKSLIAVCDLAEWQLNAKKKGVY